MSPVVLVVRLVGILGTVLCLCGAGVVKEGGCPDNVLPFAAQCLPAYLPNGLISNLTALHLHCREGVFERSVQCVSDLRTSCEAHREQSQLLARLLDLQAWRTAWNVLCASLQDLQENYACWTMTLQMSAQCIQNKMEDFRRQLTSLDDARLSQASSSSSSTLSLLSSAETLSVRRKQRNNGTMNNFRIYCNASKQIHFCFQPSLYEFCPLETSRLLENTYLAFQPPLCQQKQTVSSEDGSKTMATTVDTSVDTSVDTTVDTSVTPSTGTKLSCGLLIFAFSMMELVFF